MPDLWMPGAEIHDVGDHAPTDQQYPPRAIAHITWDRNATAAAPQDWVPFDDLVSYFTGSGQGSAPHIIWDPFTGRIAQLFPADSRSKSVVDQAGGTRTNRAGRVVIQVEAVFFPYCRYVGQVYASLADTPCAGWDRLHAWIASWGVPDVWPMGRPVDFTSHRDEQTWETRGGWYAHAHVPENDHQDPGSWPSFATAPTPTPATEEDPLAAFTRADLLAIVAEAVTSQPVRDTVAYAVWEYGIPNVGADWQQKTGADAVVPAKWLAAAANPLQLQNAALAAQVAAQGAVLRTVLDTTGGLDTAAVEAAIERAVAEVRQALADGVDIHVSAATTTPKES